MKKQMDKNKLKIIIIIAIALLLIAAIAISWVETYWYYVDKMILVDARFKPEWERIIILVNLEVASKIDNGEITVEDFECNNIEKIEPYPSPIEMIDKVHYQLFLKKKSQRDCARTLLHVKGLPFIIDATSWI